ncbi:MAG: hypothetical protein M5R41_07185 [Bacteroidia bacterium]|nr:hypothetical protein [Bacteroidia bacterium]
MVRINKGAGTPAVLAGKGAVETEKLKKCKKAELIAYAFSSKIYGHATVKDELKRVQHGKCCFCEARVAHVAHGDVEHYRPKGGWMQKTGDALHQPGYYWLAFEFSNLYFSCQKCNQVYKKNYFPLRNPSKRAKTHRTSISREEPLIVDIGTMDPSDHLSFNAKVAVGLTDVGKETIVRTGLNRKELLDDRLQYLRLMKHVAVAAKLDTVEGREALSALQDAMKANSLYSLMIQCNFP